MAVSKILLLALVAVLAFAAVSVRSDEMKEVPEEKPAAPADGLSYDGFTEEQQAARSTGEEKMEFKAEVTRLMDIIINSLYSKREIFIRELISNAADAMDKYRFVTLSNAAKSAEGEGATAVEDAGKLDIKIKYDRDRKTLTFTDSGIGMTKEDLKRNLGIVAKSGTSEFVEAATKGQDSDALSLIGQFGVGFYSVYLVADTVTVISKHADDDQYIWQSSADKTFTVTKDPRGNTLGRGTQVILKVKSDAEDFLNENELKKIVTRYSEFVNYPIYLHVLKTVEKEVPDPDAEKKAEEERIAREARKAEAAEKGEDGEDLEVSEEDTAEDDGKPKMKKIHENVWEWEQVNSLKAIWTRNSKDITDEEYSAFYKTIAKDETGPLKWIHFTAEGEITFRSILYIPKKAPPALYDKFYEKSTALKLYVRRVLISDEFDDFLPRYLNFIKGVVDSDDLPLNVSRETLAQSRVLKVMAKKITRKVLEMLKKMADNSRKLQNKDVEIEKTEEEENNDEDGEKSDKDEDSKDADKDIYMTFWKNFGKSIKLGCIDDRTNKPKLSKLLRFVTSKSEGKLIGLEDYVDRMKQGQKFIYYITGDSLATVQSSPFLERLTKKGLEVLFLTDPLDEYLVQSLTEFDGTQLQSITKEGLKLGDEDKIKALKEEYKELTTWLQGVYGDKVEKVTVSNRIANSPCILVTSQYGWSANMERIMKAQTFANQEESSHMHSKKTMEINPRHPIIKELKAKSAEDGTDKQLIDLANLLYDSALLQSGFSMRDTNDFASRIHRVISNGLSIDPSATVEEEPEEPEPVPAASETEGDKKDGGDADAAESHDEL